MPSYQIKQSSTECPLVFLLVSSTDHITGLASASPTVTISKAGGSFASPSGAVSEIANGWYKVAANATDSGTLGPLVLHATATGADPCDMLYEVVAFDPQAATNLGLSALPTANPAASGGLPTVGTGAGQVNPDGTGAVPQAMGVSLPSSPTAGTVGEALKFADTRLDAAITTRQSGSSAVTLPANPPSGFLVTASYGTAPGWYSAPSTPPTTTAIATAVWEDLTAGGDFGTTGSIGKLLVTGPPSWYTAPGDPWGTALPGSYTSGTAGYILGNRPTASSIATAVWQDTTSGDFTVTGSIGKSLLTGPPSWYTTPPTTTQIATAVWGDTTSGDFTTSGSPGYILKTQLAGAFTTSSSSAFSTTALAAAWDVVNTGATHNVNNSTGKQLRLINPNSEVIYSSTLPSQSGAGANQVILDSGASSTDGAYVGDVLSVVSGTGIGSNICVSYTGSTRTATIDSNWSVQPVASDVVEVTPTAKVEVAKYLTGQDPATLVWAAGTRTLTGSVSLNVSQVLSSPRALDAVADASLTVNDALHCAIAAAVGKESVSGTTFTIQTPSTGTTLRTFTLDSATAPRSRS